MNLKLKILVVSTLMSAASVQAAELAEDNRVYTSQVSQCRLSNHLFVGAGNNVIPLNKAINDNSCPKPTNYTEVVEAYNQQSSSSSFLENLRIAHTHETIFIRDNSFPELGNAYRDPSGLIWSNVISTDKNQNDADKVCKKIGARLPTFDEFLMLKQYLGGDSEKGYSPYAADGLEVLPGLSKKEWFYSSSLSDTEGDGFSFFYIFNSSSGTFSVDSPNVRHAVRCVRKISNF